MSASLESGAKASILRGAVGIGLYAGRSAWRSARWRSGPG